MKEKQRNPLLEEIDPKGIFREVFKQYVEEISGKTFRPVILLSIRQKFGMSPLQFRVLEENYLQEQKEKREKERQKRYGKHIPEVDIEDGETGFRNNRRQRHNINQQMDRGEDL